ncbi:verrucotoxin subunit beta-like [Sinocyclocheilus anshuiensis]|uniref:verrucotoxin subunit beta-like n=1 Tax=Sinocyclocheilus anshuiensis TaxID=1608454 RepID=UPI0007BA8BCF|nr:PREDICTED: verrucotoxin subunit beta-like [Sinocyclocheilus anshuiensis]
MDSVGVNVIESAALGRPFQLGMLYDCRKDALIPGITLWDNEQLQQNVGSSGVSGAAKYLSDTKKSFKQQRLTLHYHSTTKFEALAMNHLASRNIAHSEVFDNDTATHVVTAVLYGADACFVFDREVSSDEDKSTVEGEVKAAFEKLKGISASAEIYLSKKDDQKTAVQKFSCTFYGDFQLPSNPASFEDALRVFADLPKLLGDNKELAVPLRMKNLPGSCILLYENGSEAATCFIPPLKPSCPVIEQITNDRVVVKVSPSCPATEELKLQYKMKEKKDWKYQSVLQGQSTATLTDLRPDTEYEIKCAAVGKLNYSVDSDVIKVTTHQRCSQGRY